MDTLYPATDLRYNTTGYLIADMELLRAHLGVDRWLLYGYSWGSTLGLACAERHAERVSEIVISGVLIHGRLDMGGPLDTAWQLARAWPGAELTVVEEAGHLGNKATLNHVRNALDLFADR